MSSPYEEIEQLAEVLPEEGESLLVTRRDGELVCEAFPTDGVRDGVTDVELYGRLVQANERLESLSRWPLWLSAAAVFFVCSACHWLTGLTWRGWWLDLGLILVGVMASVRWIQLRQLNYFRTVILPMLQEQLGRRQSRKFTLIAAVRQHSELRTLMDFLVFWDA